MRLAAIIFSEQDEFLAMYTEKDELSATTAVTPLKAHLPDGEFGAKTFKFDVVKLCGIV